MNIADILLIYEYNYWANEHLLNYCAALTDAQYTAPFDYSVGGVRDTLIHILDVELSWRRRMQGDPTDFDLTATDLPTLDALRERWAAEKMETFKWLNTLSDDDLDSMFRFAVDGGMYRERVLWHGLYHVVDHGTQHRSEVAELLSGYGHSPGDMYFMRFMRESGNVPADSG